MLLEPLTRSGGQSQAWSLLLFSLLAFSPPGRCRAQTSVRVVDSTETPLAGASVQLWSARSLLASGITGRDGLYRFSGTELGTGTGVVVRAIGFQPVSRSIPMRDTVLEIRLRAAALLMTGIEVQGTPPDCRRHEEPTARRLWSAAATRYSTRYERVALGAHMRWVTGVVLADRLGQVDTAGLSWGQRGAVGSERAEWREWITSEGYARPPGTFSIYGRGDWDYPPLESTYAQHFADSSFGRLSKFTRVTSENGDWILTFCPQRTTKPFIVGTIEIGPDTSLVAATWEFHTQRPAERAGGEVVFAPRAAVDSEAFLLPALGLFWREGLGPTSLFQVWEEFRDWIVNWQDILQVPPIDTIR
jgi:hypothetical protein